MFLPEAFGPKLVDLLPELRPTPDRVGHRTEAQDDLGAGGFPAHALGAEALLDQTLAGRFGHA
jgi:hypothetical protein